MLLTDAISEFILDGQTAGWSAGTVKTYQWHLAHWVTWCAERQVTATGDVSRLLLRQWGASLAEKWQPATRKGAITAVRALLNWLAVEGGVADLAAALRMPRVPRTLHRTITAAEVRLLLAAAAEPAAHGLSEVAAVAVCARNAALVALLFDSLLRAFELCALTVADVDTTDVVSASRS
ncbi:MAG: site-specific integrase, partial [bacterium]